jgi:hypothetical protein
VGGILRWLGEVALPRFRFFTMGSKEMLDSLSKRGAFEALPDLLDAIRTPRTNLGFGHRAVRTKKLDVIVFTANPDFAGAGLEVGNSLSGEFFELICR